jgi:hypothetical protein
MKRARLAVLATLALASSATVFAQGVELAPAYVTGSLSLTNAVYADKIREAYVYATADGGFSSSVQAAADGTYTLTLNAPADGSERVYQVYARMYLTSGYGFFRTAPRRVAVTRDTTQVVGLSGSLATLKLRLSATNGRMASFDLAWYDAASLQGPIGLYWQVFRRLSPAVTSYEASFDFPAGVATRWVQGRLSPEDTDNFEPASLAAQDFAVEPGETVELSFEGTFPPIPEKATLRGTITLDGIPSGIDLDRHRLSVAGRTWTAANGGSYTASDLPPGSLWLSVYSDFKNNSTLSWPYKTAVPDPTSPYPYLTVAAGEVKEFSPHTRLAGTLSGTLAFTGVASLADVPEEFRRLFFDGAGPGSNGSSSVQYNGGYAVQYGVNANTGRFVLPVTAGTWIHDVLSNIWFRRNLADPDGYVNCAHDAISPRKPPTYTVAEGQSVDGISLTIPTGSVKIRFAVTDGSLVSSPTLRFAYPSQGSSALFWGSGVAYGPSQALHENQATLIGPPAVYTVNASATVNGSLVTFNPKQVVVIEGVEQVLEIDGPSLSLSSPQAELYTYDEQVSVAGTADDDVQVASVSLNGGEVATASTGNPEQPHQVGFSVPFALAKGPNRIVVKVLDSAGKIAQDTRYVYRDRGAPALAFTPATSTVSEASVVVRGTATDDNVVSQVFVNGLAVSFSSSGSPGDSNEVAFTTGLSLKDGPNPVTVTVVDNCKRTTAETHVVTKADEDTTPPVLPTLPDVVLEQASPAGTAHALPFPTATDDRDPAPVVTSDAPAVFPPGTTLVTWTASDASGNRATAQQTVLVRDTMPPVATLLVGAPQLAKDGVLFVSEMTPFALSATDSGSGVAAISYDLGSGPVPYTAPISLPSAGSFTLRYSATDAAGNREETHALSFAVDAQAPAIAIAGVTPDGVSRTAVTPEITVLDPLLASFTATLNGMPFDPGTTITQDGSYTLAVAALDLLGHASSLSVSFRISTNQAEVPGYYFLRPHLLKVYWDEVAGAVGYDVYLNGRRHNHCCPKPGHHRGHPDRFVRGTWCVLPLPDERSTIEVRALNANDEDLAVAARFTIDPAHGLVLAWPHPRLPRESQPLPQDAITLHGIAPHHSDVQAYYAPLDARGRRSAWVALGPVTGEAGYGREAGHRFSFRLPLNDRTRGRLVALRLTGVRARHEQPEETGSTIRIPKD